MRKTRAGNQALGGQANPQILDAARVALAIAHERSRKSAIAVRHQALLLHQGCRVSPYSPAAERDGHSSGGAAV
jgi:hypothetical protein